ncbi:MAG: hypothetical protein WDW36_003943 [Sanguina aurantia]
MYAQCAEDGSSCVVLPSAKEIASLCEAGQGALLVAMVQGQLQDFLQTQSIPLFWSRMEGCQHMANAAEPRTERLDSSLRSALKELCTTVDDHCSQLSQLSQAVQAAHLRPRPTPAAAAAAISTPHATASHPNNFLGSGSTHGSTPSHSNPHPAHRHASHPATDPAAAAAAMSRLPDRQDTMLLLRLRATSYAYRTWVGALLMATATLSVSDLLWVCYSLKLKQLVAVLDHDTPTFQHPDPTMTHRAWDDDMESDPDSDHDECMSEAGASDPQPDGMMDVEGLAEPWGSSGRGRGGRECSAWGGGGGG